MTFSLYADGLETQESTVLYRAQAMLGSPRGLLATETHVLRSAQPIGTRSGPGAPRSNAPQCPDPALRPLLPSHSRGLGTHAQSPSHLATGQPASSSRTASMRRASSATAVFCGSFGSLAMHTCTRQAHSVPSFPRRECHQSGPHLCLLWCSLAPRALLSMPAISGRTTSSRSGR